MYYEKKIRTRGRRKATIYVDDFSRGITSLKEKDLLPLSASYMAYNTMCGDGAIKDGFGIKKSDVFKLGVNPVLNDENKIAKRLYYFKSFDAKVGLYVDYLMFYGSDKQVYQCRLSMDDSFTPVANLTFESEPECVSYTYNGKDVAIFSCKNIMKLYDGEKVTTIDNAPVITSMCIHNERLFATEGNQKTSLWFSDDFNPMNWNISIKDAGFIDLRDGCGSLLKVISFGGYVYVFRNYGITRITAFGDQTAFSVDGIAASSGKIYGNSITICGDKIIYLAEDGFYGFSGGVPVRILRDLDGYLKNADNKKVKGCYYNGIFYCNLTIEQDGIFDNVLLVYDVHSGNFSLCRGFDIVDFINMEGDEKFRLLFLCKNKPHVGELVKRGEFFGYPIKKVWKSGNCDLGTLKDKTITKITLWTDTHLKMKVKCSDKENIFNFESYGGIASKNIGMKGCLFSFEMICDYPNMNVTRMKIDYEY